MNLGPSKDDPASRRPFQQGRAVGTKDTHSVAEDVEWVVDTGADIASLWDSVGSKFDSVRSIGVTASPTTGSGAMQVVSGIDAEFEMEDAAGNPSLVRAVGRVAVKSDDGGHNVLGAEQLADAGARVVWDPRARLGSLQG